MERKLDFIVIRKDHVISAAEKKLYNSLVTTYSEKKGFEVVENDSKLIVYKIVKE